MQGIPEDQVFTETELDDIRHRANTRFPELRLQSAAMYSHDSGVLVKGKTERQWVYFPGVDGGTDYDWALWKVLGKLQRTSVT